MKPGPAPGSIVRWTKPLAEPSSPFAEASRWQRAVLAARILSIAPADIGGVVVRARQGPALTVWLSYVRVLQGGEKRLVKVPSHISEDRLLGGLDLAASLRNGRPEVTPSVLARTDGGVILIPAAERMPRQCCAYSDETSLTLSGVATRVSVRTLE